MANFNINPTSGTGNATITVTPISTNNTEQNLVTTLTVSDGNKTKTVTLTQLFKPTITQFGGSQNVPATGGTLMYTVRSYYDFTFFNVPNYITITSSDGTIIYNQGQKITAPENGWMYIFLRVAANNTTSQRTAGGMYMAHYINNTVQSQVNTLMFTQAAGESKYITAPDPILFTYKSYEPSDFDIDTNCTQVNVSCSDTDNFQVSPSSGTNHTNVTVQTLNKNISHSDLTATITLSDNAGVAPSVTCNLTQQYFPWIELVSGSTTVPSVGETLHYRLHSEYDYAFNNLPTFATIIVNGTAYTQSGTRLTTSSDEINDIYVQVSQNLSTSGRSATFNIGHFFDWESTQENEKINVTINQAAFEPGIVPSTSSITMEYNDSGATFNVNSNIVYNASISNTTDFTLEPSSGESGTTTFEITNTSSLNDTGADLTGIIELSSLLLSDPVRVNVVQRFIPTITQFGGSQNVPATGGTLMYTVRTDYPFAFFNVPTYVRITNSDGTVEYSANQRIEAPENGWMYIYLHIAENTTAGTRGGNGMNMGFIMNGVTQGARRSIIFIQAEPEPEPSITVSPDYFTGIDVDGETSSAFTVTSNTDWYVNTKPSWITTVPSSGHSGTTRMTIIADSNVGGSRRTGTIVFYTDTSTPVAARLNCQQEADAYLNTDISELELNGCESGPQIYITSNQSYTISSDSAWIQPYTTSGNGDMYLDIYVSENTGSTTRNGIVTIGNNYISKTVSVSQNLKGSLSIDVQSFNIDSTGGTDTFTVTSTSNWEMIYAVEEDQWITFSEETGESGTTTVTFTASVNNTGSPRTFYVDVMSDDSCEPVSLEFNQD